MSPARERALAILREHPGISAAAFGRLMWPDSKGHTTRSHRHATAAGGAMGAGIAMTAGAFLWRMNRDGLTVSLSMDAGLHGRRWYAAYPMPRGEAE